MEYIICRSYDVCRISGEDLIKLQAKERNAKRCFIPMEIQELFALPPIKEAYQIPENDSDQSRHNQRIRSEFRSNGLMPASGDFSVSDLEAIHKFDYSIRALSEDLKIGLPYQGKRG